MMQQVLVAHEIPTRVLDLGMVAYMGLGSPAALQVPAENQWMAQLLLAPLDDEVRAEEGAPE
jgi:hypothetical protein